MHSAGRGLVQAARILLLLVVPYEIWHGLFAPAGVPDRIVRTLHREVVRIVQSPLVKDRLLSQGFEIVANTPEQFAAFIRREIERYRKVVAAAGIKVE